MFGKVPPSNTPGPPPAASCVTSITKSSSCGRQTAASASTCLPCFSVEETPIVGVEEKPKPWRPKDTAGPVVSEAPCNTLQSIELPTAIVVGNVRRNDPAKCNTGNGISGSGAANSKYYSPKDSLSISSSSSASSSSSSSSSSSTSSSSSLSSQSGRCQSGVNANTRTGGQISTSSTHNRCSSNYGCSFGKPSNGLLPPAAFSRSQRIVGTAVHVDACTDLRETSKHHRKHLNNANSTSTTSTTATVATSNRESASERDQQQPAPNCVLSSKDVQSRYAGSASVPQANSKANPVRRISCDAVGSSAAVGVAKSRVVVAEANCDQPSLDPASLASSASVDLDGSLLGAQVHPQVTSELARVAQKSPVALMTSRSPIARNDISSNDVDTTTTTTTTTTTGTTLLPNSFVDRSATCKNDFVTSTPSKEHRGKDSSDTNQQNCVSCLPQDLPTELQSSSPRSYKDRERCRDPWRPTEMEGGNQCALNPCPSDVFQDGATKRRTGASCQALRHAVASLNRLDDFYMEKIGAGFFSEVFKVTHKVTAQVMVLKMNQLPANRPNMLKEVQLMNKLSHPNILRFMGVCVHEGQLHALTEYINGGSLEQLIMSRHAPLPHLIRMNLAKDVARGMAYLHSRGLFHRDLTSKNVLIKKDETNGDLTAVVGDFGLAAKIPDPSSGYRLSTVGSPYWMSPECLKGQWYDHRSDVFSFGIVVCELIGRVPADPDVLPRSDNFGLDYLAVAEICAAADPPPAFLQLAFDCCTYEPKSRPTFPEIVSSLESMINNYEEESKTSIGNRQSADPALMSSMDEIVREGRTIRRKTARLRSQSADARGCDNATPSDKARCHSARRVAELASKRDPHYRPMTANPFHALGGVKKILGNLFSSCLELPSLEDVRPSVTDVTTKFKPAQNDTIVKILERKKPSSEPSSPTARKKWERKVATKVGAASLFAHPLFRDGWEPRRRGSCESGFWSCVGEDLSPEPPNRRHTSTLSSSAASSLFLLDDHRTSSIYTDSSEDIASLGGGDSSCWEDRLSGIGSSSKTISKIVEYFERKQAASGSLRLGDHDAGPSRMTLLRASLEGPVPLCSISAAQRLVVCEGAVRSKLPLFDKK